MYHTVKISNVKPISNTELKVTHRDGRVYILDLSYDINNNPYWNPLRSYNLFRKAKVIAYRHVVSWNEKFDISGMEIRRIGTFVGIQERDYTPKKKSTKPNKTSKKRWW